ncbi:FAD-dependent monooxygenase [Alsobacter sp. R-9]
MSAAAAGAGRPILIAGAGIAGLTLALMLARAGRQVVVLEKRTRVEEVGAGIQLSPNASRILLGLGLGPALARAAGEPEKLVVRRGIGGGRLVEMPLGAAARERFGAPYYVVHRADLQTILLDAVRSQPEIRLVFGRGVVSADTEGDEAVVAVEAAGGAETFRGDILVGADGLWSRVAHAIGDHSEAEFSGFVAWRGLIPAEQAPPPFRRQETGLWLGPNAHVVHYPLRGGKVVNVVAVISDRNSEPGWSRPGDPVTFQRRFRGWSPELRALFEAVPEWQVWSLFDRAPRQRWVSGRVGLIGDAAHPLLPFLAQGGACAIEDAAILTARIGATPLDLPAALRAYETVRRPRAAALQNAGRANGRIYHMPEPFSLARDFVMRQMGGEGLMKRYAWLYEWKPDA